MPTTKPNDYSPQQIALSISTRALAHPSRVKMMDLLVNYKKLTNKDLSELLHLSKSTVHDHVIKIWEGGLITIVYQPHAISIEVTKEQISIYKKLKALFDFDSIKPYHFSLLTNFAENASNDS